MALAVVVSCEHGGNEVPAELREAFADRGELLRSHRGWDPGALELAERFETHVGAPLIASRISRLVVDLNRSTHHRACLSEVTRDLPRDLREALFQRYYHPHRLRVEEQIERRMRRGVPVLHLAVHTFAPVLDGVVRRVDLGLLYDPRRRQEKVFCRLLAAEVRRRLPELRTRFNSPYRGCTDGLTTALRHRYEEDRYLGIEVEVSQGLLGDEALWRRLLEELPAAVRVIAAGMN